MIMEKKIYEKPVMRVVMLKRRITLLQQASVTMSVNRNDTTEEQW